MTINVTYGTVKAAAEDIRSAATNIDNELENLHSRMQRVVATWEGDAKAAYQSRQGQWNTNTTGLVTTLRSLANQLEDSISGYKATDKKSAQQFDF